MAEIPAWLASMSPIGALVLFVLLVGVAIVNGALIPGKTHDRIVADKDKTIAKHDQTVAKLLEQSDKQLENDATVLHLLQSLPKARDSRPDREVAS